jgi:hypothetical protein
MHGLLKQPGYRLHPPDNLEAWALLAEQDLSPADLTRALAHLKSTEKHRGPCHRRDQGGRRLRRHPSGLATRPVRRAPRALHPAALGQGSRAARPRARGQHGAVRQGRHAAGRSARRRRRLPAGQLKRRPEVLTATDFTPPWPRASEISRGAPPFTIPPRKDPDSNGLEDAIVEQRWLCSPSRQSGNTIKPPDRVLHSKTTLSAGRRGCLEIHPQA